MRWGGFCGKKLGEFLKTFLVFADDLGGLDEAAEGEAAISSPVEGGTDAGGTKVEVVGLASNVSMGSRGPVATLLTSIIEAVAWTDIPASHKE